MNTNIIENLIAKENERHEKVLSHIKTIGEVIQSDEWLGSILNIGNSDNTNISAQNGQNGQSNPISSPPIGGMTVGERIIHELNSSPNGLRGGDFIGKIPGIKSTSISSTLYLLKKNKKIKYDKAQKLYLSK